MKLALRILLALGGASVFIYAFAVMVVTRTDDLMLWCIGGFACFVISTLIND